jgi:hypothetical protein
MDARRSKDDATAKRVADGAITGKGAWNPVLENVTMKLPESSRIVVPGRDAAINTICPFV